MEPLQIALIVLVVAGIWAIVELALTLRKTRSAVEEVTHSAQEAIEQVQPIIAKADGMVDDLQPSMKHVNPMLLKATTSVDLLNANLAELDGILSDMSNVSGAASQATLAAGEVVDHAASAAAGLVNKITGKKNKNALDTPNAAHEPARLTDASESEPSAANSNETALESAPTQADSGYVTYDTAAQPTFEEQE
ncbi:DUF948 domain-containing protein [uncultured Olegusella sp.]|uniref:DUF948 domain-containing protein n=1 Tax=uncultured Olegusella sp. TaxID=1979846 RepID=UPI00261563B6|nr:DUF948 domain-containing protein [uncultured Olegusella sp.]